MTRQVLFILLLLGLSVPEATAQSAIFIVRHAEKSENGGNDPELSNAGRERAEALAVALKDANIKAIYATEFKRTQQTAAPFARASGIEMKIVPASETESLAATLKGAHANALVVAHSNTLPALLKALGVTTAVSLTDADYDNLMIAILDEKPRLIRLHYR